MVSIDDYIKSMKQGQKKIYYVSGANKQQALNSPFMEVFKDSDVPILILTNNVDEIILQ